MRKQFHKYFLDSQSPNGLAPMELNATMSSIDERIGESQSRAEGTDLVESIASLVRSREREVCRTRTVKEGTRTQCATNATKKSHIASKLSHGQRSKCQARKLLAKRKQQPMEMATFLPESWNRNRIHELNNQEWHQAQDEWGTTMRTTLA